MRYEVLKKIKGIKSSEKIMTSYWSGDDLQYIITKDPVKPLFFLYEVANGIASKTKFKSNSPYQLEENIIMI